MTERVRVVVIGGGAVGCSALYHLALMGWTDALLLERDELSAGSTWHAAGNCPTFSTSWNVIKLQTYGARLYRRLGDEVDYPIGYHATGSIRLAHSQDRMDEFRHVAAMAHAQGLDYELITPKEARERFYPFLELHDLEGALWDPLDGDVDPSQLTQAYAKGARELGARIRRGVRVSGLERRAGDWHVSTDKGEIVAEVVVNAAGYRAGEIMTMVGHDLPIVAMSHQYLVTEAIPALQDRPDKLPLLRDVDTSYYLRQERAGLLLGPYEWRATAMWQDGIPEDFGMQLWEDDLERLEWYIEDAIGRVPILGEVGVQRVINGPIPYAPDGFPYVGPAHGLTNFYQCCCFSFGIAQSGGAGKALAEWVVEGEPEWDGWSWDPRRYTGYATKTYCEAKAIELYQREYGIAFPYEERPAGRPARVSPLYHHLEAKGARFGARGGWERATWFGTEAGEAKDDRLSFRRSRNWFEAVGREVQAVRERAGILDLPGFTRFIVSGPGAERWLDQLVCTRLPRLGRLALAWILNERGSIVCEFTITRLAPDRFHLLSAASAEWHDEDLLSAALPSDGSVQLESLTSRFGTLVLAGPRSREILAAVTPSDVSNRAFPWLTARTIEIGCARPLVLRVNYVGELGFEVHAPMEALVGLYQRLWEAGQSFGLADFGMYAMDSLRLEKGYRGWKTDLGTEYSPLASSLDRFIAFDKSAFVGRDALLAERQAGPRERLVLLSLDEPGDADAPACAPVHQDGAQVGLVTSGVWSYTLEKSLALAYVRSDLARPGSKLEVEILGGRRAATVEREPLYDPDNARLRA